MKVRNYLAFACVSAVFLLSGCVSTTSLSMQDRQSIHTVMVDKNISVPKDIYIYGPNEALPLAAGGLIGGLMSAPAAKNDQRDMQQLVSDNHINIGQIVRNQFINQINSSTGMKVNNRGYVDANLVIAIKLYGVTVTNPFSSVVVPLLSFDAKLIRNNQMVWEGHNLAKSLDKSLPRYTMQQIQDNPQYLYQMWNFVAQELVGDMVKTL